MGLVVRVFVMTLTLFTYELSAQPTQPPISRPDFQRLWDEISNWGRWGADDQLGTLNLITPAKRQAAAREVIDGVSISLSLNVDKGAVPVRFRQEFFLTDSGNPQTASDSYEMRYHGYAYTHIDGLQHVAYEGKLYNGVPYQDIKPNGMETLGIQNIGLSGIFSRGVLVDMPRFLGVDYLTPETVITLDDMEAWEESSGVTVQSGDVLLIRTGRWVRANEIPQPSDESRLALAGVHPEVAAWLRSKDVAVIGTDGVLDVQPAGVFVEVESVDRLPLHTLVIAGLGMPLLDNLDLEALADQSRSLSRSTFLFTAAPLRVPGGTGSPLNPLAVF